MRAFSILRSLLPADASQKSQRPCPVCRANGNRKIGDVLPTTSSPLRHRLYSLWECQKCDLIYLDPAPSPQDLKNMYEESTQFTSDEYREPEKIKSALEYYSGCVRNMLSMISSSSQPKRLLEVGAGVAWVSRAAKEGYEGFVTVAQDVSPECANECSWVDEYVVGDIWDEKITAQGPYDIISLTHVIEHLADPMPALSRIGSLLQPSGCVLLTAPHRPEKWRTGSDSTASWEDWSYHHVPGHLQYFSERAMKKAALDSGLRLVSWSLHENGQAFEAILRRQS